MPEAASEVVEQIICNCEPTDLTEVMEALTKISAALAQIKEAEMLVVLAVLILAGVTLGCAVVMLLAVMFK